MWHNKSLKRRRHTQMKSGDCNLTHNLTEKFNFTKYTSFWAGWKKRAPNNVPNIILQDWRIFTLTKRICVYISLLTCHFRWRVYVRVRVLQNKFLFVVEWLYNMYICSRIQVKFLVINFIGYPKYGKPWRIDESLHWIEKMPNLACFVI